MTLPSTLDRDEVFMRDQFEPTKLFRYALDNVVFILNTFTANQTVEVFYQESIVVQSGLDSVIRVHLELNHLCIEFSVRYIGARD